MTQQTHEAFREVAEKIVRDGRWVGTQPRASACAAVERAIALAVEATHEHFSISHICQGGPTCSKRIAVRMSELLAERQKGGGA